MAKNPGDVIIRRNKKNKASESAASSKTEIGKNDKKTSKGKSLKNQIYSVTTEKQIKIISVLLFLFSFLLLIALISYTPKDEAFTELSFTEVIHLLGGDEEIQVKADNTQNWMGLLGAVISNSLYNNTLGYSIIIIPFLLFFYAKDLFKTNNISSKLVKKTIVYLIFATLFASLFGALRQFDMFSELPREFCGAIGLFTASVSSSIIGSIGAFLLFSALILITVILGTDINI
ncbi:MAG: DNA translocase FtsK 4TM domain-containing protein, partial [Chlorobi bacterium]|nr:DNA translocase FtsK 4TM domain-containing protein [Chlorobiota bacterium]